MPGFDLNRRSALKMVLAVGGLTIAYPKALLAQNSDADSWISDEMTLPLITIHDDNSITIHNPNPDMGQGTSTGLPMILAEELDADWSTTKIVQLPLRHHRDDSGDMKYTYLDNISQGSGGSGSVRRTYSALRKVGATARHMLLQAAASQLGVPVSQLSTNDGNVINSQSNQRIKYADLRQAVANMAVPEETVPLKSPADFKIIGKDQLIKAGRDIVLGKPIFGYDQEMKGMLHASIARTPHFCGKVKSINDTAARGVKGVVDIIHIEAADRDGELAWEIVEGVAVIADSLWAALKARKLLRVEWAPGPFEGYSSAETEAYSLRALDEDDFNSFREKGDFDKAFSDAEVTYDQKYVVAHAAHAMMEPHSAIADVRGDAIYCNMPCQFPGVAARMGHAITGIPPEYIYVEVPRLGGGFGRRFGGDFPAEAIFLSHKLKKPIKVIWSREDELTQDRYRNANHYRISGAVNAEGKMTAMRHRQVSGFPSLHTDKVPELGWLYHDVTGYHFPPEFIKNSQFQHAFIPSPVPRGPWRAPGSVNSAFAQMSFIDEFAHKLGRDPLEFNLAMLEGDRSLKLRPDSSYGFETKRMANCLKLAAKKAGWGKALAKGRGMGIAGYFSHQSYVAHVVDVFIEDGDIIVERVISAADCGIVVNPLSVKAQIEGAIHDALSVVLAQEITVENAAVQETNFDSYIMARMDKAPKHIEIYHIEGAARPTGMGEPGMPPFAPALTNAIFSATGKRIRRLPIADQLTDL